MRAKWILSTSFGHLRSLLAKKFLNTPERPTLFRQPQSLFGEHFLMLGNLSNWFLRYFHRHAVWPRLVRKVSRHLTISPHVCEQLYMRFELRIRTSFGDWESHLSQRSMCIVESMKHAELFQLVPLSLPQWSPNPVSGYLP